MIEIQRRKNQSVVIGDGIIVTIIEIRSDKVRLGIQHPKGVTVHRKEIHDAIRAHLTGPGEPNPSTP